MPARRITTLILAVSVMFALLGLRLFYCQILWGGELAALAVEQRRIPLSTLERGDILYRDGTSLTDSDYRLDLVLISRPDEPQHLARRLADFTGAEAEAFWGALSSEPPVTLLSDLSPAEAASVSRLVAELDEIMIVPRYVRYGAGSKARHLVGHLDGNGRGAVGLESAVDHLLRSDGRGEGIFLYVDARGVPLNGLGVRSTLSSALPAVVTTIDPTVQRIVEDVMDRLIPRGAVVVVRPETGEVLAMASRPNYEQDRVGAYLDEPGSPLVNRALRGYPPGSVFKVVTAAAALESGIAGPYSYFNCGGYLRLGERVIRCRVGGHGTVSLAGAMTVSCNTTFVTLGLQLGPELVLDLANRLGFGRPTGLGLDESVPALPRGPFSAGDTANIALGQGELLVTPVQVARMMSAIADEGILRPLRVITEVRSPEGVIIWKPRQPAPVRVLSRPLALTLKSMLLRVVREGTGQEAAVHGFGVAGKTGTAETGRRDASGEPITHAWFAGFFPYSRPEFTVVVLVEEGGLGGDVAARAFSEIAAGIMAQRPSD